MSAEQMEIELLRDLHALVDDALAARLGLSSFEVGGGVASVAAALPASAIVVNRTVGLGLSGTVSSADLDRVVEAYRSAGVARYFIQVHERAGGTALDADMAERGLEKARGWQVFERGSEPPPQASSGLAVREAGPGDAEAFAALQTDAFDLGDVARPWMARKLSHAGEHVFMALNGDTPAACAAVMIRGRAANLGYAATAPAFRGRGAQSALLARRIAFALDKGCTHFSVCTGEAVPGDPQHSYSNIRRAGFTESFCWLSYAPTR